LMIGTSKMPPSWRLFLSKWAQIDRDWCIRSMILYAEFSCRGCARAVTHSDWRKKHLAAVRMCS
jgi:hypothetical protein